MAQSRGCKTESSSSFFDSVLCLQLGSRPLPPPIPSFPAGGNDGAGVLFLCLQPVDKFGFGGFLGVIFAGGIIITRLICVFADNVV